MSEAAKSVSIFGGYFVFAGLVSFYFKEVLYICESQIVPFDSPCPLTMYGRSSSHQPTLCRLASPASSSGRS